MEKKIFTQSISITNLKAKEFWFLSPPPIRLFRFPNTNRYLALCLECVKRVKRKRDKTLVLPHPSDKICIENFVDGESTFRKLGYDQPSPQRNRFDRRFILNEQSIRVLTFCIRKYVSPITYFLNIPYKNVLYFIKVLFMILIG